MGTAKKCYKCFTEVEEDVKICPRCNSKLGARTEAGIALKAGSPLPRILFAVILLAAAVTFFVRSHPGNSGDFQVQISTGPNAAKDGAIQKIKEKGAAELKTVGVADIGYSDDTLCVYVDQRFNSLSRTQQEQLLTIVAAEWEKAIGKTSTAVKVMEYGTKKTLSELVV